MKCYLFFAALFTLVITLKDLNVPLNLQSNQNGADNIDNSQTNISSSIIVGESLKTLL